MDALEPALQPTRRTLGDVDPAQPLDLTHPLLDGLQGFWLPLPRLTGGSRLYDLSAEGNDADFANTNSPTWTSDPEQGPVVAFNSSNSEYADTGIKDDDILGTSELSVAGWVFLEGGPGINNIFSSSGDNNGSLRVDYRDGDKEIHFGLNIDGVWNAAPGSGTTVPTNEWVFFLCTMGSGAVRIHLNGEETYSNANGGSLNRGGAELTYKIGSAGDLDEYLDGRIASLLFTKNDLHRRSLELYNQARRGFPDLLNRRDSVGLLGGGLSPISGSFALTDAQEQISATGQTKVSGTLFVTSGSETLTVDGATKVSGTASITEAAEQISGVGSVITTGAAQITDAGEIISAVSSLQDITGTAQITDAAENVEATGEVKIAGTATLSDGTEEVIIIGQNDVTGSVSFADLAAEIAAEGAVEVQGSLALTDLGESISARERVPARLATVDVRLEDIIIVNAKLTD
jgi:hypothetical protein